MSVKVVTPPDEEPISLEEAKSFLHGIDYDDQDDNIEAFIKSARIKLENRCGRAIAEQEFELTLSSLNGSIILPRPPVSSVTSIVYIDRDGSEQTIDSAAYLLVQDELEPYVFPVSHWPKDIAARPDAVRIRFVAGSEPDDVPEDLKQAMRLLIGAAFEIRQETLLTPVRQEIQRLDDGVLELIAPYIVPRL